MVETSSDEGACFKKPINYEQTGVDQVQELKQDQSSASLSDYINQSSRKVDDNLKGRPKDEKLVK